MRLRVAFGTRVLLVLFGLTSVLLAEQPATLAPPDKAVFALTKEMAVTFSWKPGPGPRASRFQLARDSAFTQLVEQRKVREGSTVCRDLAAGTYYWRHSVGEGVWSAARQFTIRAAERRAP